MKSDQAPDWSEHLLAAQKALKTAEACLALKMWDAADRAVYEWKEAAPQSGADKL